MPKQINYQLDAAELAIIQRALTREKRPEVRHRAAAIHLLHQGQKPAEVAATLAVTVGSVYKWHQRWRSQGLEGLANQPRSGPPVKADVAYWQRVGELLELDPSALGYPFTIWTAQRLVAHLAQETGVRLSVSRFRAVLKEQGYVYRRPKHDLKTLQDPAARVAAEAWLLELKKVPLAVSSPSSLWTQLP